MKIIPDHLARSLTSSGLRPSPVIALTILRDQLSADEQILTVVRNPATNITHPDIVSVPTQRIPPMLMENLLAQAEVRGRADRSRDGRNQKLTFFRKSVVDNVEASGHDPVIYSVESILARKLGLGEALEQDLLRFEAWPAVLVEGQGVYSSLISDEEYRTADGEVPADATESLMMLNVAIRITEGADLFPAVTGSYRHVQWSDKSSFLRMTASRDPAEIGLDQFKYCVGGLCVDSSDAFLQESGKT